MIWEVFISFGYHPTEVCQTHHSGKNSLHDCTDDIGEISQEPYDHKLYTQTLSAAASEVFDDLRREDDDPAGYD
jgi:hypothetical protein